VLVINTITYYQLTAFERGEKLKSFGFIKSTKKPLCVTVLKIFI
jgi:hypothetical protein